MTKRIWSYLPHLSLLIIVLALLKMLIYYNAFNVPIKYYIGLSELGLLIADDLFILVPIILFLYFLSWEPSVTPNAHPENTSPSGEINRYKKWKLKNGKLKRRLDAIMPYIAMGIFTVALVGLPLYIIFTSSSYSDKLYGVIGLIVDVFFFVFVAQHEKLEQLVTPGAMPLMLFGVMFLTVFLITTSGEITSVEEGRFRGTKIITSDSTYVSSDTAFYIGQTSNYVFFYNKKKHYTTVLPISEVKRIDLSSD